MTQMRKAGLKVDTQQELKNERQPFIGQRLIELRNEHQMTQEELADKLEVSRQAISKWESDRTFPSIDKLFCMSELYQVSLDYLLTGKTPVPPDGKEEPQIRKKSLYVRFAAILLGILLIINCVLIAMLLFHQNWNKKSERVEFYVDTIYEQYTKAKVVIPEEDGSYTEQVLWLDAEGIRENDWDWCHDNGMPVTGIKWNYNIKTLLLPIITAGILLVLLLLLCMEMRKNHETNGK